MTEHQRTWTLGVDFGTSNTAAAYRVDGGPAQPVRLSDQAEQVPSAVLALDSGIVVGGAAVRSARLDPQRFEPTPKRRIGEGEILLGAREWQVTQLISEVLNHVKQKAMWVAGGQPPRQLILTYPQQWAQGRKDLLRQAAAQAGFDPSTICLVTEPIAAATWYASTQPVPAGKCVAVFDFGGGTCDVAVLRASNDNPGTFTVLAADGIDPLGGELLDLRLLDWTLAQLADGGNAEMVEALSAPENLGAMLTLKEQVKHAKHELSEYESARIPVAVGSVQQVVTITSAEFDRKVGSEIDEAVKLTRRALVASGQSPADLHALYLTGGSSHLRLVHRKITELLGRPPATFNDPKLVVAQGALLVPDAALEHSGQPRGGSTNLAATMGIPRPAAPPQPVVGPPSGPFSGPIRHASSQPSPYQGQGPQHPTTGPAAPPPTGPATQHPPTNPHIPQQQTGPGSPHPQSGPFTAPVPNPPPSAPRPDPGPSTFTPQFAPGGPGANRPSGYQPANFPTGGLPPNGPTGGPPPGGSATPGRPKWLIPAIAAAVAVIVAVVLIFVTQGKSDDVVDPVDNGGTTTASVSTSSSSVSTSTDRSQRCPNGSTVSAEDTCPTDRAVTCWDNQTVPTSAECAPLEGQAALEWVFPVPTTSTADTTAWTRSCQEYTDQKYDGELEVFECTVDQLPQTTIFISRWDSSASAQSVFAQYGESTDFRLKDDGDVSSGLEWSKQIDITNDDNTTTPFQVRAMAYRDSPFTILLYFGDPTGVGTTSAATWDKDQLFRSPESIAALGTV